MDLEDKVQCIFLEASFLCVTCNFLDGLTSVTDP